MNIPAYYPAFPADKEAVNYLIVSEGYTPKAAHEYIFGHQVYEDLLDTTLRRKCKTHGHDLVDDSYGDPDSGCIAYHCTRCGWACHHQLY